MPLSRPQLTFIKRALISARVYVQEAAAAAQRGGERQRFILLREIADRIADELDDLDRQLERLL